MMQPFKDGRDRRLWLAHESRRCWQAAFPCTLVSALLSLEGRGRCRVRER
jgi:hypothetical protein